MSLGIMERGDDRNREVSVEHLNEMFTRPSAPALDRTDVIDESEARIGEFAPFEDVRITSLHPARLGKIGLRHAPYQPHEVEIYTGS